MKQVYILNRRGKGSVADLQPEQLYLLVDETTTGTTPTLQEVLTQDNVSDKSINLVDDLETTVKTVNMSAADGVSVYDESTNTFAKLSQKALVLKSSSGNDNKRSSLESHPNAADEDLLHVLPETSGDLLNKDNVFDVDQPAITEDTTLESINPIVTRTIDASSGNINILIDNPFVGQIWNFKRLDLTNNTVTIDSSGVTFDNGSGTLNLNIFPTSLQVEFLSLTNAVTLSNEVPQTSITIIADTTVALNVVNKTAYYGLTGTATLASLPPIAGNEGKTIIIANKSEANQFVYSNDAVSNDIWFDNADINVVTIQKNVTLFNDGVNWTVISYN